MTDAGDAISSLGIPTLLLVRSRFAIHPPLTSHRHASHRCRPCLRRERKFMSSAQAVLLILLNLTRAGFAQRKSLGLRFKSASPTSFTGYVSIFCLAKASAWLDQHHLPRITGRCSSPCCNYGRLRASRSNCACEAQTGQPCMTNNTSQHAATTLVLMPR